jgi:glycerol kinase
MSERTYYLVIDQGGHASRAVMFDKTRQVVAIHSVQVATQRDGADRVEHDAKKMIASVKAAVTGVIHASGIAASAIESIGIATQRSSIVCWDRNTGVALSPVLSWQDRRTAESIHQFSDYASTIHKYTGLVLSPHYGATKLQWCLENLPEVQQALHDGRLACGPLSSFILFNLVDEKTLAVDPANASRTLLWNYRSGNWEPELLRLFGIPHQVLPRCVPNRHDYGHVRIDNCSIPVSVMTGDQSAALYAFGLPRLDTTYINIGTGAFLQRPLGDRPVDAGNLLTSMVWQSPDESSFVLEGTVNGAASALQQFAQASGINEASLPDHIAVALATVSAPPLFLNGVSGLGSPFWLADFPSRFIGEGTQTEKLAAVIESIAFLINANLEAMTTLVGRSTSIVVTGGLSASDGLCQRLANLSRVTVARPQMSEATAHGVAFLLAGIAGATPAITTFRSVSDLALRQRYRQWLEYLNRSLPG